MLRSLLVFLWSEAKVPRPPSILETVDVLEIKLLLLGIWEGSLES